MAAGKLVRTPSGWTRFGPGEGGLKGSGIIITDQDGNDWGLSVTTAGVLTVYDADALNDPDLDTDSDGTAVDT